MKEISQRLLAGEQGVQAYRFQGIDKIAGFAPVGINGWSIGATQNKEEFTSASKAIRNSTILIAALQGPRSFMVDNRDSLF